MDKDQPVWDESEIRRAERAAEDVAAREFVRRSAEAQARRYAPYNETVWMPKRRSARWAVVGDQS